MAFGWIRGAQECRRGKEQSDKDTGPNRRLHMNIKRHGQISGPQLTSDKEREQPQMLS